MQFQSKGLDNDKILKDLEHNPNILAYLLSNIDQSEIVKAPAAEEAPAAEKLQQQRSSSGRGSSCVRGSSSSRGSSSGRGSSK